MVDEYKCRQPQRCHCLTSITSAKKSSCQTLQVTVMTELATVYADTGSVNAAFTRDPVLVDLALQGGGSHGAFTWGVLDRLLEEPWLEIDGISGTSAGAMNAAVLVDGYAKGGADGARKNLETFWRRVSE